MFEPPPVQLNGQLRRQSPSKFSRSSLKTTGSEKGGSEDLMTEVLSEGRMGAQHPVQVTLDAEQDNGAEKEAASAATELSRKNLMF